MLVEYGSDSDAESQPDTSDAFGLSALAAAEPAVASTSTTKTTSTKVASSAPFVLSQDPNASHTTSLITRPTDTTLYYNATYEDMSLPVQGPTNPFSDTKLERMNTVNGHIELQAFNEQTFKEQQRTFHVLGYAQDPSVLAVHGGQGAIIGDAEAFAKHQGTTLSDRRIGKAEMRAMKRKRAGKGKVGEFDSEGEEEEPEAAEGEDESEEPRPKKEKVQKEYIGPWAGWEDKRLGEDVGPTEEELAEQELSGGAPLTAAEKRAKVIIDRGKNDIPFGAEKSVFHGTELFDYMGRSYLHAPTDVDGVNLRGEKGAVESFLPKKCVHTWSGHTQGVSRIRLFPQTGHLILSASLDARIKLWDIYNSGKCLRTFSGHSRGVHDVNFNNTGKQFLSASFDRHMKLWDTESGACVSSFSTGKIPYCVVFHPEQENVFLAGMHDKKIVQYDMRSGEITQEYDQHLGPVNTITFVDENRRFVTTSDDKTIRAWDYDIPVVIKYIAEPSMHSMPAVGVHPNHKWLAMQSLDNQILIFGSDTFKQNRKKRFAGHSVAGYACQPQFSPDGRFLSSGDGQGGMVFWDWKSCKIVSRLKAHSKAIISHEWLPHESSKVVTSSWDGLIKLWD